MLSECIQTHGTETFWQPLSARIRECVEIVSLGLSVFGFFALCLDLGVFGIFTFGYTLLSLSAFGYRSAPWLGTGVLLGDLLSALTCHSPIRVHTHLARIRKTC